MNQTSSSLASRHLAAAMPEPVIVESENTNVAAAFALHGPGNPAPRWSPGERLHHLFEARCDELAAAGENARLAVAGDDAELTFDDLDRHANRLARYLSAKGYGAGDVFALLFDRSAETYTALLAVLKINAAYVPLDITFPAERIRYIVADAGASVVLTLSAHVSLAMPSDVPVIAVDADALAIALLPSGRLTLREVGAPANEMAYIIYTSGSTGRPKGVPIEHASICNFVRVAAERYGYRPGDRVYQGLTLAFDFSVEEIWVPLLAGATLVPNQTGSSLVGYDLHEFLVARGITALCCVPTLLATLEEDVADLRLLIVSGEACPRDIVTRWHCPGRTILNAYGPTEATVTATIAVLDPDSPITIGAPLPTYTVVILDPDAPIALAPGATGEIAIAGIGLSPGYWGRDDLTRKVFVPDFLNLPDNPSARLYRTGDLGRVDSEGRIEYLGRIDTQVKIRGYRIELTEIESVLMQLPGVLQAVVSTHAAEAGCPELVAYYTESENESAPPPGEIGQALREMLPNYMVPAFYEKLDTIPMLPCDKANRRALPPPSGARASATRNAFAGPATPLEIDLTELLADVLKIERISAEDDFFDDLGANSLLMARFSALVRGRLGFADISMRAMYLNRNIRSLAAHLASPVAASRPVRRTDDNHRVSALAWYGCGALQLAAVFAYTALGFAFFLAGLGWVFAVESWLALYGRSLAFAAALFALATVLPVAAKWLLVGRWHTTSFPVWGASYLRFWVVKTLTTRTSPILAFVGTPLYTLYLRALGARIGRGAVLFCAPPACPDLVCIGKDAVIGRKVQLGAYKAESGRIRTGRVTIGDEAFVGDAAVLDIDTELGARAQLAHASSAHEGQRLRGGMHYHGCPATATKTDFRALANTPVSTLRQVMFSLWQLSMVLFVYAPLPILLFGHFYNTGDASLDGLKPSDWVAPSTLDALPNLMLYSALALIGGIAFGLVLTLVVPRLAYAFLRPETTYPLYGVHHALLLIVTRSSNSKFFNLLFGDSIYIVGYLRAVGYRFHGVRQTGSNFGVEQRHDVPFLCEFGYGTMASDDLAMANADFANASFRLGRVCFGAENFIGNTIVYPTRGRTGDNVLFGTKVMVPVDGAIRENTGLLGSPAFEIPRSVIRDHQSDHLKDPAERQRRLARKTRYNSKTIALFLLARWGLVVLLAAIAHFLFFTAGMNGAAGLAVITQALVAAAMIWTVLLERAATRFKALQPQYCSIYEPTFWRHERFWKFGVNTLLVMLNGTPFKPLLWRLLGVRMGRRVFDDGAAMPEKTLVRVGDYCTLNREVAVQAHSLEDGMFKTDHIVIGDGVTLGVGAFVHYDTNVGTNASIEADTFLMKGESVAPNAQWSGNPARQAQEDITQPAAEPSRSEEAIATECLA